MQTIVENQTETTNTPAPLSPNEAWVLLLRYAKLHGQKFSAVKMSEEPPLHYVQFPSKTFDEHYQVSAGTPVIVCTSDKVRALVENFVSSVDNRIS